MKHSLADYSYEWENDEVAVNVPFSVAGVGTTIIVESKFTGKKMLLDVGDGATQAVLQTYSESSVEDLTLIAISHGHFDHIGGLYSLLGFLRMLHRKGPLDILFPEGCVEVPKIIESFRESFPSTIPFEIRCHELKPGVGFETDFFKLVGYQVQHFDSDIPRSEIIMDPSLGYRVNIGGTVVAYTGDTGMFEGLRSVVEGADLALIEATYRTTPESTPRAHLSLDEAQKLASYAKNHLIIHQIPDWILHH